MVNYREILRLKSLKYSQREIALSVHSSRNTVKEVVDLATALKIVYYGKNVPLFRRNGYRKSGAMIP